ncbi:Hypothetical protein, putative [Bodo saltans]|uniref:Uncharacterized protein n=1 Tax=Bodo saltans TaxID=75058 RepID=A0A0S4IUF7_BODSA|nr:Hypothetical protein, putative [Bodo saltans]|eukprot:CUE90208.1 Hypothetical protein, putative [Bodo saltans]
MCACTVVLPAKTTFFFTTLFFVHLDTHQALRFQTWKSFENMHPYNIPSASSPPPRASITSSNAARRGSSTTLVTHTYLPPSLQCTIFAGEERPAASLSQLSSHRVQHQNMERGGSCQAPFFSPHIPLFFDPCQEGSKRTSHASSSASPIQKAAVSLRRGKSPRKIKATTDVMINVVERSETEITQSHEDNIIRRKKLRTPKKVLMPAPTPPRRGNNNVTLEDAPPTPWTPGTSDYDTSEGTNGAIIIQCHGDVLTAVASYEEGNISPLTDRCGASPYTAATPKNKPSSSPLLHQPCVSAPLVLRLAAEEGPTCVVSPSPLCDDVAVQRGASCSAETQTERCEPQDDHGTLPANAEEVPPADHIASTTTAQPSTTTTCPTSSIASLLRHTAATMGGLEDRKLLLRYYLLWRLQQRARERSARRNRISEHSSPLTRGTQPTEDSVSSPPPPAAASAPTPPPRHSTPNSAGHLSTALATPRTTDAVYLFTPSPIHDDDVKRSCAAAVRIGRHDAVASQLKYEEEEEGEESSDNVSAYGRSAPITHHFTKNIAGSSMRVTTVSHRSKDANLDLLPPRAPVILGDTAALASSFMRGDPKSIHNHNDGDDGSDDDDNVGAQQQPLRIKFFHGSL